MSKPRYALALALFLLLLTSCTPSTSTDDSEGIDNDYLIGTVEQDTPCYIGPGPEFEIAVKLKPESQISIIGASEKGEYVVVDDPNNLGQLCWVDSKDVYIPSDSLAAVFRGLAADSLEFAGKGSNDGSVSDLGTDNLIAEFMRMNTEDPDSSDSNGMTYEFYYLVAYRCPDEWSAQKAAEPDESDESDPVGQAAHDVCTLGGLICHTYSTIDNSLTECGYLVFPVYYIRKDDCLDRSDCVTSTPPPVAFIPCTPTPNQPTPYILNLTLCWNGPGPGYEGISSLEENTTVEVLGVGENSDYIVITNPRYNRPCWVKDSDIELDGLNVADMKIFEIPIQDDLPDSPEMGCMVASSPAAAPKCIKPCPDPVAYPVSCEP